MSTAQVQGAVGGKSARQDRLRCSRCYWIGTWARDGRAGRRHLRCERHAILQRLAQADGIGERRQANVIHARSPQLELAEVEYSPQHSLLEIDLLDGAQ